MMDKIFMLLWTLFLITALGFGINIVLEEIESNKRFKQYCKKSNEQNAKIAKVIGIMQAPAPPELLEQIGGNNERGK